jgi:hypothetical protein
MTSLELLADLCEHGFTLAPADGGIRVHPASRLTTPLREAIRAHKGELLALLHDEVGSRPPESELHPVVAALVRVMSTPLWPDEWLSPALIVEHIGEGWFRQQRLPRSVILFGGKEFRQRLRKLPRRCGSCPGCTAKEGRPCEQYRASTEQVVMEAIITGATVLRSWPRDGFLRGVMESACDACGKLLWLSKEGIDGRPVFKLAATVKANESAQAEAGLRRLETEQISFSCATTGSGCRRITS